MTIQTRPRIYYIDPVSSLNNFLNFREPNALITTEKTASLNVGSRTMTDLMTEVERALNDAGENTYSVSFNRSTRIVTISADDTFELLVSSGTNNGLDPFSLLGFIGSDRTGASTYDGDSEIGTSYVPQFLPQSFKSFDDNLEGVQAVTSESAGGIVEVVTFGQRRFMEFNLFGITNVTKTKSNIIQNNPNGLGEARSLMEFLISKSEVEFMIDESDVNTFDKILLESTRAAKDGTGFRLTELINRNLNDHYETGVLKFRKVE